MRIAISTVLISLLVSTGLVEGASSTSTTTSLKSTTSSTKTSTTKTSTTKTSTTKTSTTKTTTSKTTTTKPSTTLLTTTSKTSTTFTTSTTTTSAIPTATTCSHYSAGKRGLGFNNATLTQPFSQCKNSNSKISWTYSWASDPYYPAAPNSSTTYNMNLRFIPMLWSAASDLTSIWARNIMAAKSQYGADSLLAFNEPDNCDGQACMSVADAVAGYKQWIQPYAGQFALGAPAVTNANVSGMGADWLSQFLSQCTGCTIDFVPLHFYGDVNKPGDLATYVQNMYQMVGKPVWVTEFGAQGGDKDSVKSWAQQVMAWMDSQSYVKRYAYLMDAPNGDDTWLIGSNGSVNAMGMMYDS